MRLTAGSIPVLTLATIAVACGSASHSSAAPHARAAPPSQPAAHCDAYASPGTGTAQRMVDSLRPGQTGCLHGGDYAGEGYDGYVLRIASGGRRHAPIRVTSAPGERARLRGIVYIVHGAGRVVLDGIDLDGRHPQQPERSQNSIQVMADHVTVADSRITNHGTQSCVIIGQGARGTVIRNNTFRDCGDPANHVLDHSIYVASSRRARIVGNVFLRSGGWAVQLYPDAQRTTVARNLMWENGGGVVFGGDGPSASNHNLVADNVIAASKQRPELASSFGGPKGRGNLARDNCLVPGVSANDPASGFRLTGNRVASGPECLSGAPAGLVGNLQAAAPALVARLSR